MSGNDVRGATGLRNLVPATAQSQSFGGKGSGMPKALTVVLCEDMLYKSSGSDSVWTVDVYDVPEIRALGPMIEQIRAHYVCEGATAAFQARVTTYWSVLGKSWSSASEILPAQTADKTGVISSWFTTDTAFGLLMRYGVEVKNNTGVPTIESGHVTVVLEIELKS
ncbi:MAG: hypothetical protein ACOZNI_19300 [Myxococcota bacterium]